MKKRWGVTLPITGTVYVEVEADTEDEAIKRALEGEHPFEDPTYDVHMRLLEGNVFQGGAATEASAEEIET